MDGADSRARRVPVPNKRYIQSPDVEEDRSNSNAKTNANANTRPKPKPTTKLKINSSVPIPSPDDYSRPVRNKTTTTRGALDLNERAAANDNRERLDNRKKRKAAAEARGNASQPGPLPPPSKRPKGKEPEMEIDIYSLPLEQLTNERDRIEWLLRAILKIQRVDYRRDNLPYEDLLEIYADPDAAVEQREEQNYKGISSSEKSHPLRPTPTAAKLGPTDHNTITPDNATHYFQFRGPNGKPTPIPGGPIMTDHETRAFNAKYSHLSPRDLEKIIEASRSSSSTSNKPRGQNSTAGTGVNPSNKTAASKTAQPRVEPSQNATPTRPQGGLGSTQAGGTCKTSSTLQHDMNRPRENPRANGSAEQPRPNPNNHPLERTPVRTPAGAAVPNPSPSEEEHDLDMEEAADVEDLVSEPANSSNEKKETKKEMAQLSKFGDAAPLVQLLTARIKLATHVVCPFGDTLTNDIMAEREAENDPDQAQAHDEAMQGYTCLLDKWLVDSWSQINEIKRLNEQPLPLEESYCRYVRQHIPSFRHDVKAAIAPLVSVYYGLKRGGFYEENVTKVRDLLPDNFYSPNLKFDKFIFQHPIIRDVVQATCFNPPRTSIGHMFPNEFAPIPLPTVALICAITRHQILEYASGEYRPSKLCADELSPWYESYLDRVIDATTKKYKNRLGRYWDDLLDACRGPKKPSRKVLAHLPEREYESDSGEEYESRYATKETNKPANNAVPNAHQEPQPRASGSNGMPRYERPANAPRTPTFDPTPHYQHPNRASGTPPRAPDLPYRHPSHARHFRRSPSYQAPGPSGVSHDYRAEEYAGGGDGKGGEIDQLDDGYADLAPEDQETYYRCDEETFKDD